MQRIGDHPEPEFRDPDAASDRVLIYRTPNAIEAKSLAMRLEDEGIEACLAGETLYEAYAGLGLSRTSLVEVWISAADRNAAQPLVNAWRAEHHSGGDELPPRFQFSMRSLLTLTTVIAVFAFLLARNGEMGAALIVVLFDVLIYVVPPLVYFYRRFYRKRPEG